jgi:hypothetical protein
MNWLALVGGVVKLLLAITALLAQRRAISTAEADLTTQNLQTAHAQIHKALEARRHVRDLHRTGRLPPSDGFRRD